MKQYHDLQHATIPIVGGGEVIVLNTGAIIDAEAAAMLQALHSRSIGGLKAHLKILEEKGADNFMANFYVGYGHASIGDCGTTTIFIEGVSMLAAKAIQDWRLYSGQEASTRYIDFQVQPLINPLKTRKGEDVLETWRGFYVESMPILVDDLKKRFPIQETEKQSVYEKAINARAFDILRGFLPAGAATNLAWTTNLRQAADKLKSMRHHPLEEVRNIAEATERALQQAHPHSFGHKRYEETEEYIDHTVKNNSYYINLNCPDFNLNKNTVELSKDAEVSYSLSKRPVYTELPQFFEEMGELQFEFLLDFGSYRDLQRHRAFSQRMPLLTDSFGFEPWYILELPQELQKKAHKLLGIQKDAIEKLDISQEVAQYYQAMGYRCSCKITGNLRALVYLVELRATRFVHKTLRVRALQIAKVLSDLFSNHGLVLHIDKDSDRFDIKRGEHDIVIK